MKKRPVILVGMAGGVIWGIALMALARPILGPLDGMTPAEVWAWAAFAPGLVLAMMIGRLAQRRFFDESTIDGESFRQGSSAEIDQRVLTNTIEQLVLAACVWPLVAVVIGAPLVIMLGVGFALTRILFWVGYHHAPPMRGFGFAAGFYPTLLAAVLVLWRLATS